MKNEKRHVPGCPGYMADRAGNVYGKDGRRMRPFVDRSGAVRVNLSVDGKQRVTHYVARMVCAAFHTSIVEGRDIAVRNHKYRSKRINKANRLRWGTMKDVKRKSSSNRLTELQRSKVRELYKQGWTQHNLAAKFGVSQPSIHYLVKGNKK